jgi:hypothetical protein
MSVSYFLTALFYSDFTNADTSQYDTWRHESSRGKLHLNLPTQLLAWRLITHYFVWFLMTERVLFVSSFYWHVTWMSVASYVTTSAKWHKHCSKGWQCIDIWSFRFSHIHQLDITVLNNNITSVEHVFSSVHVSSRTSSRTTYCRKIQLHSLSVSQYILVAAVKTKPKKFWIQFITNVRVLVDAHFPVLCSVYGIFPFSRALNFIVTNPMVHGLL